jgi:hypothetical protein
MPVAANISIAPRAKAVVLLSAGLIMLLVVGMSSAGTLRLVRSGQRAKGIVTSLYAGPAHPKVEFIAKDGRTIVFPGNGFVSHRVGDTVDVLYTPENPEHSAVLEETGALWMFDASSGMLGLVVCAAGVYLLRKSDSRRGSRNADGPGK